MSSKKDAYSSIESTFLKIKYVSTEVLRPCSRVYIDVLMAFNKAKALLKPIFKHHCSRFTFPHSNNEFILISAQHKT